MPGPALRTDLVDIYVFRRVGPRPGDVTFLQLRRAPGRVLAGTWQPVMGHVEPRETAAACALRELGEETGYAPGDGLVGFWQLEEPNIYFLHAAEAVMLSPCFAAEVATAPGNEPTLNPEHDAARWVARDHADRAFLWPGQRRAIGQIVRDLLAPDSPVADALRIDPGTI